MKVIVIIVTYNGIEWVRRCFDSLKESIIEPDVFVVDNGSKDGTQDYIKKNYPKTIFQQSSENLGFGKANNIGLQYALDNGYDYAYLLNQDAWIFPETIGELIRISKAYPEYGILSPFQINANGQIDNNFYIRISLTTIFQQLFNDIYNNEEKDVYEVPSMMAAHWFLPRKTIIKIGGFSPSFPHYGEDDNYSNRVIYHGFKIGITPKLRVVHDRAWRKSNKEKEMYSGFTTSIYYINNPLVSPFSSYVLSLKIAISNAVRFQSYKPLFYFFKLVGNSKKYMNNRRSSKNNACAFLKA